MRTKLTPIVVMALILGTFSTALAQTEEILPCSGENIAGTVIGVEDQTVIVETEGGSLCSVTLSGEYEHPIVELLGNYFGDVSAASLAEALGTLETSITCEEDVCEFAGEGSQGTAARVISVTDNGDGTWTIEVAVEVDGGEEEIQTIVTDDEAVAMAYMEALESLLVEWNLSEGDDGSSTVVTAGDDIAAYHEDGYGFGVLVKVYAIAEAANESCGDAMAAPEGGEEGEDSACGATVEEIMTLIDEGAGMGQLFQEYGRPTLLGVGHIRQLMNDNGNGNENGQGVCNARANGGNANANGRSKIKNNGRDHPNPVQCDPVEGTDPLPEPEE
ncbi:MAG: hypothetical protein PVG63_05245 [Anaerolineales bacterium]|jgi:hypothetical protein